jgi:hypothetical protein
MGGAMATQKLSTDVIQAAIEGFEVQKRRINEQIGELRQLLTGDTPAGAAPAGPKKKKRRMSAAGRKAIAEAQRKRWASTKKEAAPPKVKRKLSAAGRKAIADATRKRWALARAQKAAAQ